MGLLEEGPCIMPQYLYCESFSQSFPKGTTIFYQGNCVLGKNNQNFRRLVDTGSELTLNPEDKMHPCGSLLRVEA